MRTLSQFLYEQMRGTKPGIKGEPSEMLPGALASAFGKTDVTVRPEEKGVLPSWLRPVSAIAGVGATLGDFLSKKISGKPLFTRPAKTGTVPYRMRAEAVAQNLNARGYDKGDIQRVLDVLGKAYGEEPKKVDDALNVYGTRRARQQVRE